MAASAWKKKIVVDDGSIDETSQCAGRAGAVVVRHPYNKGNGAAVKSGIRCFFYGYGDHRDLHSFPTRRSSDLVATVAAFLAAALLAGRLASRLAMQVQRSEERRVGKECRSRWSADH